MATTVKVRVLTGPHRNRRFCFQRPACGDVGRAADCLVQLSGAERDCLISRHHCRLEINPPCVLLRDLGSSNGTFLNGARLEPTELELMAVAASAMKAAGSAVKDGDIITIGGTSLRVEIVDCPPSDGGTRGRQPVWNEGEVAKRDCPIPC